MQLSKQQKDVLHTLVDKYESRSDYGKKVKHSRRTILSVNKSTFPLYYHDTESEYRITLNQDIVVLNSEELIELEWVRFSEGEELKKVFLNDEKVEVIYHLLGIESKTKKYSNMLKVVNDYADVCPVLLKSYYNNVLDDLKHLRSVPSIIDIDSTENTVNYLKGLNALLQEKKVEVSRRKWSILLYNDSKKWGKLESKILSVVKKYVYDDVEVDDKELLAEWGIVDNPQQIRVYGPIVFSNHDKELNLSMFNNSFGLDTKFIEESVVTDLKVDSVVTIENLTSYYDYIEYIKEGNLNHLVVYLGGFHNSIRRKLLLNIVEYINKTGIDIGLYHWGDIDLGGIRIWKHLSDKLNVNIIPIFMDEETYNKHKNYGKKVETKTYVKQLEKALDDNSFEIFHEVIKLIIKNQKIIEQEIVLL